MCDVGPSGVHLGFTQVAGIIVHGDGGEEGEGGVMAGVKGMHKKVCESVPQTGLCYRGGRAPICGCIGGGRSWWPAPRPAADQAVAHCW